MHSIFMQEREACEECNGFPDTEGEDGCTCEEPALGKTFNYDRCDDCDKFLRAIEAAEIEVGCDIDTSRPALTSMIDDLKELRYNDEGIARYWQKSAKMYPERSFRQYLGWLFKKYFV
jgi:hypothetical protein